MKPTNALEFLRICGRLKRLKRTGWVNNGVELPESVADHMYRMAMCGLLLDEQQDGVDRSRCIKMAIVHDLAESFVGDITPYDGVAEKDKHQMEKEAMDEICSIVGTETAAAQEMQELWSEYETGCSAEARMVKDFDKFEMILQADEYEGGQDKDLESFFSGTEGYFKTPLVQSWDAELRSQRQERKEGESKRETKD